jgi:hypothetical protein
MTGANLFDLSPRTIDGRYPGKAVAMLAHMVFKVNLASGAGRACGCAPSGWRSRCCLLSSLHASLEQTHFAVLALGLGPSSKAPAPHHAAACARTPRSRARWRRA